MVTRPSVARRRCARRWTRSSSPWGRRRSTSEPQRASRASASAGGSASPPHRTFSRPSPRQPASISIRHVAGVACITVAFGAVQQLRQPRPVGRDLAAGQDDATAHGQRQEQLQRRNVERQRRDGQQRVAGRDARLTGHGGQQVNDGPVGHDDALGPPGRAGGIQHVGRVFRRALRPAGPASPSSAAASSTRTTRAPWGGRRSSSAGCVSSAAGAESETMSASRAGGKSGSSGT